MNTQNYQHNAATIEITKTDTGYNVKVTKNRQSIKLTRRSHEEARKAARYYAERM